MAQSSAAAVIDLQEFRRRREGRAPAHLRREGRAPAHLAPTGCTAPPVLMSCWIVWVPVWFAG